MFIGEKPIFWDTETDLKHSSQKEQEKVSNKLLLVISSKGQKEREF